MSQSISPATRSRTVGCGAFAGVREWASTVIRPGTVGLLCFRARFDEVGCEEKLWITTAALSGRDLSFRVRKESAVGPYGDRTVEEVRTQGALGGGDAAARVSPTALLSLPGSRARNRSAPVFP